MTMKRTCMKVPAARHWQHATEPAADLKAGLFGPSAANKRKGLICGATTTTVEKNYMNLQDQPARLCKVFGVGRVVQVSNNSH